MGLVYSLSKLPSYYISYNGDIRTLIYNNILNLFVDSRFATFLKLYSYEES